MGGDRTCEIAAHALAAAGVSDLRWISRAEQAPTAAVLAAWQDSNPEVTVEWLPLPGGDEDALGAAWLGCLRGASAILRSGFDDDPLLAAAVRLGIPVVVVRTRAQDESRDASNAMPGIDLLSFRVHGPCPHVPLDRPRQAGAIPDGGALAVVAGHLAATELLVGLAGVSPPPGPGATARLLRIPFSASGPGDAQGLPHSADIPWSPACFACGGSGQEMTFS